MRLCDIDFACMLDNICIMRIMYFYLIILTELLFVVMLMRS